MVMEKKFNLYEKKKQGGFQTRIERGTDSSMRVIIVWVVRI